MAIQNATRATSTAAKAQQQTGNGKLRKWTDSAKQGLQSVRHAAIESRADLKGVSGHQRIEKLKEHSKKNVDDNSWVSSLFHSSQEIQSIYSQSLERQEEKIQNMVKSGKLKESQAQKEIEKRAVNSTLWRLRLGFVNKVSMLGMMAQAGMSSLSNFWYAVSDFQNFIPHTINGVRDVLKLGLQWVNPFDPELQLISNLFGSQVIDLVANFINKPFIKNQQQPPEGGYLS